MTLEIHYRNNIIIEFELPEGVRLDQLNLIAKVKSKMSIDPEPEKEPEIMEVVSKIVLANKKSERKRPGSVSRPVIAIDCNSNHRRIFNSAQEASDQLEIKKEHIYSAINNQRRCKNYMFLYGDV